MFAWRDAARATIGGGLAIAGVAVVLSGGSPADPRTPEALPGMPAPFLGVAAIGSGGLTAAVDAYGDIVDLRPGPAGPALVSVPAARQAAGSVALDSALVPRVRIGRRRPLPLWRADSVRQHYLPGSNALRTEARIGASRIWITCAAHDASLDCVSRASGGADTSIELSGERRVRAVVHLDGETGRRARAVVRLDGAAGRRARAVVRLDGAAGRRAIRAAVAGDRRWLSRARPLGAGAPGWARQMYRRSLLVLRAMSDSRTGAVAAGARDSWAYVWPRDAGATAIALAAAGYRQEARRVARFLLGLELRAAARFRGTGTPVAGRRAQGDAWGWVAAAARATGLQPPARRLGWRGRGDYQEGDSGNYLGNAIAATGMNGAGRRSARLAATDKPEGPVRGGGQA